ncbi:unnamed protein product [Lepeophtheirus salmonis]|uniref:(salmon louse) hypothetical protein n=1 Tax=Lepeophtheirus salmonis TaxID=72036 RepID=A0A7R8CXT0_LEPSM|nr:unnamed protein product [Lepeophtheirus salmonis]CAF2935382.1 unnamed protein product [Lepeophtheirus salmonis]
MNLWLDTEPKLVALGSDKMEPGKARAIYGTAPQDQAIITYLVKPIEGNFKNNSYLVGGHSGIQEVADIGIRLSAAGCESEITMLDYADFNYEHTLEALFDAVLEILEERFNENNDLIKAARWARDVQDTTICQIPSRR